MISTRGMGHGSPPRSGTDNKTYYIFIIEVTSKPYTLPPPYNDSAELTNILIVSGWFKYCSDFGPKWLKTEAKNLINYSNLHRYVMLIYAQHPSWVERSFRWFLFFVNAVGDRSLSFGHPTGSCDAHDLLEYLFIYFLYRYVYIIFDVTAVAIIVDLVRVWSKIYGRYYTVFEISQ